MNDFTYETEKRTAKLENYEWDNVWWDTTGNEEAARALYIGDSISCATRRLATAASEGKILFDGFGTSKAVDNPYFIPALRMFAEQQGHRDVIFFNNGLHGWRLSEEEYAEYYEKLVCFMLEEYKDTPLVLVLITFVTNEERNKRVIARNEKARAIAEKYGLDTVDLYAVSQSVKEYIRPDGVHFSQEGSEAFAAALVECARKYCKQTL